MHIPPEEVVVGTAGAVLPADTPAAAAVAAASVHGVAVVQLGLLEGRKAVVAQSEDCIQTVWSVGELPAERRKPEAAVPHGEVILLPVGGCKAFAQHPELSDLVPEQT